MTEGFRTPVVPLIRHGCAVPPSPLRGEGFGRFNVVAANTSAFLSSVMGFAHDTFPWGKAFCFLPRERVQGRILSAWGPLLRHH